MFQALLTRRYLFSKVMPLLASVAVTLCTAMVLIVWSVMGGFLNMLLASGRSMIGDVSISYPAELGGIPNYERVIERLLEQPEVAAATPTLETYALLGLPDGDKRFVVLIGVQPEGYDAVTGYYERLYWIPLEGEQLEEARRIEQRLRELDPSADADERAALREQLDRRIELEPESPLPAYARTMRRPAPSADPGDPSAAERPALVPGVMVSQYNQRTKGGHLNPLGFFLPNREVSLTVLAFSQRGVAIDAVTREFPVANEFESGLYDADSRWVLMPLEEMQRMLKLDEAQRIRAGGVPAVAIDPQTGEERLVYPEVIDREPARVSHILIRAAEGITPQQLEAVATRVYNELIDTEDLSLPFLPDNLIYTWEEKPGLAGFIAAVKKETVLVLFLFGVISLVAVFLVFAIFWAMVSEKTKDIGVLRAIGASTPGVAWLFLRYGMAIGIVGALAGLGIALLVVTNINAIHAWMGTALGIEIWNPETYYFSTIPSDLEVRKAIIVVAAAIISSLLGALVPALRAAFMDPVKALRFE
ncbi:MAG: ABC transporter permease [Phycisphaerales bacterium]